MVHFFGDEQKPMPDSVTSAADDGSCPGCGDVHRSYVGHWRDKQGEIWDDFVCDECGQHYSDKSDIPF